jgi:hypothetical protein
MLPLSRGRFPAVRAGAAGLFCLSSAVWSIASSGCLFPDYTFDESNGGQGGKGTTSSTTTTTTTTIASTSASSTDAVSSSSTGMMPTEDCFNGKDDDADQLADCDDPDCEPDTQCVDAIPTGWNLYGYVVLGEGGAAPPTCPSYATVSKYSGFKDLTNTGFSCSNCGCGSPENQACSLQNDLDNVAAGLQLFQLRNVACSNMNATNIKTLTDPAGWDGTCDGVGSSPGGQTCAVNA